MSKPEGYPATPNLDLQTKRVREETQAISGFIDFLFDQQGYFLGEVVTREGVLGTYDDYRRARWGDRERRRMIERFFGMDPDAAEAERDAVYRWVRDQASGEGEG